MPRKRMLTFDGLANDEDLVKAMGPRGRGCFLYECLWSEAEDWGGYEYKPKEIARRTGAFNFNSSEVEKYITILIEKYKIVPWTAPDGREIHWLRNFLVHQHLSNPIRPKLPLPPWVTVEERKTKQGKPVAGYLIITSQLPEKIRSLTSNLPVSIRSRSGSKDEKENNKGNSASGAPSSDKVPEDKATTWEREYSEAKPRLYQLSLELCSHFNIKNTFNPSNQKAQLEFHPIGFIFYAGKCNIPVPVILKVMESMTRQKADIKNPHGWLLTVLGQEHSEYNYTQSLKDHEERKNWSLSSILNLFNKN